MSIKPLYIAFDAFEFYPHHNSHYLAQNTFLSKKSRYILATKIVNSKTNGDISLLSNTNPQQTIIESVAITLAKLSLPSCVISLYMKNIIPNIIIQS